MARFPLAVIPVVSQDLRGIGVFIVFVNLETIDLCYPVCNEKLQTSGRFRLALMEGHWGGAIVSEGRAQKQFAES